MPNNTGNHSVVFLERFILLDGIHTVLGFLLAFPLLLAAQRREPQRITKYSELRIREKKLENLRYQRLRSGRG